VTKLTEIVKRASGSSEPGSAIIDTPETLKEMLVMSVPLMKRQVEGIDVIMSMVKSYDFASKETSGTVALVLANLLEETEVDSFAPAPRALDTDHIHNPEFQKLMVEMSSKALFGDMDYQLIEELTPTGARWYIRETPKAKR
jgi:hypothetical protein